MRTTTLLIDLDGVIRLWSKDYSALEQAHDLLVGSILHVAFESVLLDRVVTGRITDFAWRHEISRRLAAANPSSRAQEAVLAWSASAGEVNHAVLSLTVRARKHCVVGLVTNATDRLATDLARLGVAEHFDFVVNSSEVGCAKPSPEIFKRALAIAAARPEEALFVDDTLGHVAAAESLGIRSHHFKTADGLENFMRPFGVVERTS